MSTKDTVQSELVLRLTDAQVTAIRLRVQKRKREIAAAEFRAPQETGVVDLGVIDSESGSNGQESR